MGFDPIIECPEMLLALIPLFYGFLMAFMIVL